MDWRGTTTEVLAVAALVIVMAGFNTDFAKRWYSNQLSLWAIGATLFIAALSLTWSATNPKLDDKSSVASANHTGPVATPPQPKSPLTNASGTVSPSAMKRSSFGRIVLKTDASQSSAGTTVLAAMSPQGEVHDIGAKDPSGTPPKERAIEEYSVVVSSTDPKRPMTDEDGMLAEQCINSEIAGRRSAGRALNRAEIAINANRCLQSVDSNVKIETIPRISPPFTQLPSYIVRIGSNSPDISPNVSTPKPLP